MSVAPLLEIKDLVVTFRTRGSDVRAVRGIDLSIRERETHAIVGESGSGKSVTMMAALGLLPESAEVSGTIEFAGRELQGLPDRELRRVRGNDIGVVFQNPMSSLNPVMRVADQIAEPLMVHLGQTRQQARKRAIELLDEVGIPDASKRARSYPHQFSGGMRQRVMIAMALACQPRLLIADEPTTGLDVTVQAQITELVQRLQQEHGMAVVWITHDLGVVAQMADRVTVMYAGRIVETSDCVSIYDKPDHPYTLGLLTAVPRLDAPLEQDLIEIAGSPPDPLESLPGCSFAPRCALADDHCLTDRPLLALAGSAERAHTAACWHTGAVGAPDRILSAGQRTETVPPLETPARPLLAIDRLRVHFRGAGGLLRTGAPVRAVDGVTLEIATGRVLGLVGESGSGKSTLGRAIAGVEKATSGRITIDGVDLASRSSTDARRRVQMVFQDPSSSMNPAMTVGQVIQEPLRINRIGSAKERQRRSVELLDLVGLSGKALSRFPHEFSGGQQQRIAIARALALEPSLLICDEAVSALDVSVQAQIVNLFARLQRELNLSLLFIAHDLAVVRHIADRVAVMYLGQIVETGTRADIYDRPQHPYTRALLAAVPVPNPRIRAEHSVSLTGDMPSPSAPPSGCRFNTRCPFAVPGLCDTVEPPLAPQSDTQSAACHLAGSLPDAPLPHRLAQQSH